MCDGRCMSGRKQTDGRKKETEETRREPRRRQHFVNVCTILLGYLQMWEYWYITLSKSSILAQSGGKSTKYCRRPDGSPCKSFIPDYQYLKCGVSCDTEDDETVADDGAEGHDGDQEVLEGASEK